MPVPFFCPFKIGLLVLLSYKSCLYILNTSLLADIQFATLFCPRWFFFSFFSLNTVIFKKDTNFKVKFPCGTLTGQS